MSTPLLRAARWWHAIDGERIQCDLCPRDCRLKEGQRGACFVRQNIGGRMVLTTWGRSSGFCVDPIEKKPLNHFHPGSAVLSFGTAGCNLTCRYCQNWDISHARNQDRLADSARPETIAATAEELGCRSVAFTYNDPVIFAEYALDVAAACRERGIATVAVTAGYIHPQPGRAFFAAMDAANIDLKAFSEDFYHRLCTGHLQPVLDTLVQVAHNGNTWLEITTLIIPGHNDSEDELTRLSAWIVRELGPDVPLHLTAFHPDGRMTDVPATPRATLTRARAIARAEGLRYVYTGNLRDPEGATTFCPACQKPLVVRDGYDVTDMLITADDRCPHCGQTIAGCFGNPGPAWGNRRLPVHIGEAGVGDRGG